MLDVVRLPQVDERRRQSMLFLVFPHEEQDLMTVFSMVNVALPRRALHAGCALALPVEQRAVDGIVLVHGRRRKVLLRLVQVDQEQVQLLILQVFDALPEFLARPLVKGPESRHQLVPRIGAVQV
jgi:hypothetical protein